MRLIGITMLRNEADIVEAFVRHNLSILDGLVAVEHASVDGTHEILQALCAEGLPLTILRDLAPAFFQAERMTALARQLFAQQCADFVFPIDADEFLKVASRSELDRVLADVPRGSNAVMHWQTYVPTSALAPNDMPRLIARRKAEAHGSYKCIVARVFVERPGWYVASGNHLVGDQGSDRPTPHLRLPQHVAALAHFPVRSAEQLERKVVLGHLAHRAARPRNDRLASHWSELFAYLRDGGTFDADALRHIAYNYGLPRDTWRAIGEDDLVRDPLDFRFDLRYGGRIAPDTLRVLMRFTEALLAQ